MANFLVAQNVGIGTSNPDASAKLEIKADNAGLLIPKVSLTGVTDAATILNPAVSLMVWNDGTAALTDVGFYFNAGTALLPNWQKISGKDAWLLEGNANIDDATDFIGSTTNEDIVVKRNSIEYIRLDDAALIFNETGVNYDLRIEGDADENLFFVDASADKVGVGTNSPNVKLDINGALALRTNASAETITADNQLVTVGDRSYLRIGSDNSDPSTRTFTLSNGLQQGQMLILENASIGTNVSQLLASSNLIIYNSSPQGLVLGSSAYNVVHLVWNGSFWVEIGSPYRESNQVFTFTDIDQTFTVPSDVYFINVKLWGAGGGGCPSADNASGGGGGFVSGTLSVVPGEILTIIVGARGQADNSSNAVYGGGGRGDNNQSASGGGRTAIQRNGVDIVTAGAGGGASDEGGSGKTGYGGAGGGLIGGTGGHVDNRNSGGIGGSQTTGGNHGDIACTSCNCSNCSSGSQYQGGTGSNDDWEGGGGGAGFYGGGGGGGNYGGGGGGGSSYVGNLIGSVINEQGSISTNGNAANPGGLTDVDYNASFGGGGGNDDNGEHGFIVIRY